MCSKWWWVNAAGKSSQLPSLSHTTWQQLQPTHMTTLQPPTQFNIRPPPKPLTIVAPLKPLTITPPPKSKSTAQPHPQEMRPWSFSSVSLRYLMNCRRVAVSATCLGWKGFSTVVIVSGAMQFPKRQMACQRSWKCFPYDRRYIRKLNMRIILFTRISLRPVRFVSDPEVSRCFSVKNLVS